MISLFRDFFTGYVLKAERLGDTVVTSGHSAVFPGGIPVGTIEEITDSQDGLSYQLKVKLFLILRIERKQGNTFFYMKIPLLLVGRRATGAA